MTDDWTARIVAAYGRRSKALTLRNDGLQVRTANGCVTHLIDDDAAVEAEKIRLGIQLAKEEAYVGRMEGREPRPGDLSCQSFFRRLLRHHRVDIARLVGMLPEKGVPLVHDRGDIPAKHLNILGIRRARRTNLDDASMGTMPSFVMEAWTPYTVTVVLGDRLILRGGSPRVRGQAFLSLVGDALPGTVCSSLVGRPLNDLVRHPALEGSGHMITSVSPHKATTTVYLTTVPDAVGGRA